MTLKAVLAQVADAGGQPWEEADLAAFLRAAKGKIALLAAVAEVGRGLDDRAIDGGAVRPRRRRARRLAKLPHPPGAEKGPDQRHAGQWTADSPSLRSASTAAASSTTPPISTLSPSSTQRRRAC